MASQAARLSDVACWRHTPDSRRVLPTESFFLGLVTRACDSHHGGCLRSGFRSQFIRKHTKAHTNISTHKHTKAYKSTPEQNIQERTKYMQTHRSTQKHTQAYKCTQAHTSIQKHMQITYQKNKKKHMRTYKTHTQAHKRTASCGLSLRLGQCQASPWDTSLLCILHMGILAAKPAFPPIILSDILLGAPRRFSATPAIPSFSIIIVATP